MELGPIIRNLQEDDLPVARIFMTQLILWAGTCRSLEVGIKMSDAKKQYLAYHEGHGGFERGSYRKKAWLLSVSDKVNRRANSYKKQLKRCGRA